MTSLRDHDPEQLAMLLAQRLKQLRKERGLTQAQVASHAGIALYTYQKFEKGESKPGTPMNPQLFTLLTVADALEVSLQELLSSIF